MMVPNKPGYYWYIGIEHAPPQIAQLERGAGDHFVDTISGYHVGGSGHQLNPYKWLGEAVSLGESDVDRADEAEAAGTVLPDGILGHRDSDAICAQCVPGEPAGGCQGDGHYLCLECEEYDDM
jgi:hypothetical protein